MSSLSNTSDEIVICGGGVIGVSIAYYLTELFINHSGIYPNITILEQYEIACSSSGKAGGFLALDWCDSQPIEQLARKSYELHKDLAHKLDGLKHYGYREVDTLQLNIEDHHPMGTDSLPKYIDWLNSSLKISSTSIGSKLTTAQVDPYLFTTTLLDIVKSRGVKVEFGQVKGVVVNQNKVTGVVIGEKIKFCGKVIVAMGAWSNSLLIYDQYLNDSDPKPLRLSITGARAHSVIFKSVIDQKHMGDSYSHMLFTQLNLKGKAYEIEVYPRPNGDIYICGLGDSVPLPFQPQLIKPSVESIAKLKEIGKLMIPSLIQCKDVKEQACYLPYSEKGVPALGSVSPYLNLYTATGHSCWGILNAPATGLAIAELIVFGKSTSIDLTPFSI